MTEDTPASTTTGHPDTTTAATGSVAPDSTAPEYSARPVAFRRPDAVAALLLLLAGIAAALSLPLEWLRLRDLTGLQLVRRGVTSFGDALQSGLWQPVVIVFGGGVLFLLGLLMLLPLRTHRFLGVLALLVSCAVAAGVLVPLAGANWRLDYFALGFFFAVAVAALGLLGSLKAVLTGPKYATQAPLG